MDHVSKKVRSKIMAAVRSRGNMTTELPLGKLLWDAGLRGYRKHWVEGISTHQAVSFGLIELKKTGKIDYDGKPTIRKVWLK